SPPGGTTRVRVALRRSSIEREIIACHSRQPQARRRVQAPRSTDEASRRIVFLAQLLSHTLAILSRKFRAWRVKQIAADAPARLPLPVSAAGMIVETYSLIGARPHIDNAEDRRPEWPALGNHGIYDRNLIGADFGRIDLKGAGEQQASEFEAHERTQPFASTVPKSSCSPKRESLRSRAASAFRTTFQ